MFAETPAGAPTLYRITINAGALGAVAAGPPLASATTGCSPVTDISNPNTGGEQIFASAQGSGAGNNCAAGGCLMNFNVQPWQPSTAYTVGQEILDTHFHIQVVTVAGTSGATAPTWKAGADASTADAGTLLWTSQGAYAVNYPVWQASTAYAAGAEILDTNGNVEWVKKAGTSGSGIPRLDNNHSRHDRGRFRQLAKLGSDCQLQPCGGWRHQRCYSRQHGRRRLPGLFFDTKQPDLHNIRRIGWLRHTGLTIGIKIDRHR